MRLSLLDRSRTRAGQPEGAALRHTVERAHTTAIRLGSGGVMLPNHQPFVVAEQFLMLASLYPNRVDLGVGRSLGFTAPVRRALRRPVDGPDSFADDVSEVRSFLEATAPVTARPVVDGHLPLFVLATGRGIEVAARLGLPVVLGGPVLARPELGDLLAAYRRDFRPHRSSRPHITVSIDVLVADTDAEARDLALPEVRAMVRSRRTGVFAPLEPVAAIRAQRWDDQDAERVAPGLDAVPAGGPARPTTARRSRPPTPRSRHCWPDRASSDRCWRSRRLRPGAQPSRPRQTTPLVSRRHPYGRSSLVTTTAKASRALA